MVLVHSLRHWHLLCVVVQASRIDLLCCIEMSVQRATHKIPSVLHWIFENYYAKLLLSKYVRPIVVSCII